MRTRPIRTLFALATLLIIAACQGGEAGAPANAVQLLPTGSSSPASDIYPGETWQKAVSPEALGWSAEKLARAHDYAVRIDSAAVMIVDDGVVVDEWGDVTREYNCHSMRKSLFSALIGIYVETGALHLSKTLEELGIDDNPPSLTAAEKQATVADLIKARSGVYHVALGEAASMKAARPERYSHAPGTFWYYNNWDFNALGTIFEQETGEGIFQAFDERIAQPLGMEDFQPAACAYESGPESIHRYYNFRMSTRDLARFGLLFLREGRWRDQQVISSDWVAESTTAHSQTGPESGYGYMWWTGGGEGLFPNVRVQAHSYYASGYRGHYVVVLPYRKLVVVHRFNTFKPDGAVESPQMGALLWLILDAAGETDIGDPPFIDAAPGLKLEADALRDQLAGCTLRMTASAPEQILALDADGSLTLSIGEQEITKGRWSPQDAGLCVTFDNPDVEGGCVDALIDGDTLRLFGDDGTLFAKMQIEPGKDSD